VVAVSLPIDGAIDGSVLLLMTDPDAHVLCSLAGVSSRDDEMCQSMLCELGNVLGGGYLAALDDLTGLEAMPGPPTFARDMLQSVLASSVAEHSPGQPVLALLHDTLSLDGGGALDVLLITSDDSVRAVLSGLGVEEDAA
jgi:chemotaxis protein CheC